MQVKIFFDDVSVYKYTPLEAFQGRLLHLLVDAPCALTCRTNKGNHFIVVNEYFAVLSERVQEACVLHEVGHILNNHLDPKYATNGDNFICIEEFELEADRYAASKGYALELAGLLKALKPSSKNPEFTERRISALHEYAVQSQR